MGGGALPSSQQGLTLKGLMSNVDWVPTLLTFAGVIPSSQSMITFDNDDDYLSLDGYNQYSYIMEGDSTDSSNLNKRDHVLFHIVPILDDDTNDFTKSINLYEFSDMEEIAMVFYDNDGNLWKFLNYGESTNIIGDPTVNSGWCIATDEHPQASSTTSDTFSLMPCVGVKGKPTYGLYQVSSDGSEKKNYLENTDGTTTEIEESEDDTIMSLKEIIDDKIKYYVSKSRNKDYLFGSFYCFVDYDTHLNEALSAAENSNAWVPFLNTNNELALEIIVYCDLEKTHPIYKLLTTEYKMPETLIINDLRINNANNEEIKKLNNRVPLVNNEPEYKFLKDDDDGVTDVPPSEINIDLMRQSGYSVNGSNIKYGLIVVAIFALSIIICLMYASTTSNVNVGLQNKMAGYQPL